MIYERQENESDEELIFRVCKDKDKIGSWQSVADVLNSLLHTEYTESKFRKQFQSFQKMLDANQSRILDNDNYVQQIRKEKEDLRKERIKLQTVNVERNRIDRAESRQELYYEYVGSVIESLPVPEFKPIFCKDNFDEHKINYLLCISDPHYGAEFKSENNEYSPEIFKDRLTFLSEKIYEFVMQKKMYKINIAMLGDSLQGLLRCSDLKINDSSIVKALVDYSRLIGQFLSQLSTFVKVEYYHVPSANHTQLRPLGTKASEIADEDLEYVIGHYIQDLCKDNYRVNVHLADENKQYIEINIDGFDVLAMHGHQIKNIETSLKDLSMLRRSFIDYLILGHYHNGKEIPSSEGCLHDTEILVCPSFVGSDPYSDSLMKGSKASVKIYGFDLINGHTETYKIILN